MYPLQYHGKYHSGAMIAVTASLYDQPLSELHSAVENLAPWISVWEHRDEPDPLARKCASDAISAIDTALKNLYLLRGRLTHEVRQADNETAARADELLRQAGRG